MLPNLNFALKEFSIFVQLPEISINPTPDTSNTLYSIASSPIIVGASISWITIFSKTLAVPIL